MSAVRGNGGSAVELPDGAAGLRKAQHFCCLHSLFRDLTQIAVSRRPLMQSEAGQTEQRSSAADNKETLATAFYTSSAHRAELGGLR